MSQGLKAQLKQLIDDGYYEKAIALLETVDTPGARATIEKLKQRIAEDEPEPEPVEPVNWTRRIAIGISLAMVAGAIVFIAFTVITKPRSDAQTLVSFYCGIELDRSGCQEYAAGVMAQSEPAVMACYYRYEYPKLEGLLYQCFEDNGIK